MEEYDYSGQLALINLFIWGLLFFANKETYKISSPYNNKDNYGIVALLTILYGVFAYAEADTYSLEGGYEYMYSTGLIVQVEPFYLWLIQFLPHSYYVFRLFIWGIAALILCYSAKKLHVNNIVFGFTLAIIVLPYFSQTRGSIGFALLVLSIIFLFSENKSIICRLIGCVGFILSMYLHKTIPVYLLIIPLAYLIPLNKKFFIISLIAFPVLYGCVSVLSNSVLQFYFIDEMTAEKGLSYMGRESSEFNFLGIVLNSIQWIGVGLALYLMTRFCFLNKDGISSSFKMLHKYSYLVIYISFLFYGQNMSSFIFTRTLHFGFFPLLFSVAYYLQYSNRQRLDKIMILLLAFSSFREIAYHVYKWW